MHNCELQWFVYELEREIRASEMLLHDLKSLDETEESLVIIETIQNRVVRDERQLSLLKNELNKRVST
ncbi:MAG: hypothetical protein V4485_06275 [Pseudomonadota bacterium]